MLEGMLNDICGADIFSSIYETLSINLFSAEGTYANALSAVRVLHNTIKPVALMLMFIYFMVAVVDKLSSDTFTWEQLWRQLAMLLASFYLIQHGFELLEVLFNVGMAMAAKISEAASTDIEAATFDASLLVESFMDAWGDGWPEFIMKIIMVIFLLIPWLLSWVMRICVSVICYSRVIEIYARATFAPIAISDFFHSGLQGGGWRFLKNFLAVCLQGGMILVIAIIYSKIFAALSFTDANLFTFIGKYLAFFASAIMLMFKSLSLTKEVLGTGG